jgi:xanthine dehydrogenase accessory factor
MSETLPILRTLLAETDAGRACALCVVLRKCGSAPQVPGATMLVRADFSTQGTLGGGCIEAEVRRRAFELIEARASELLEFNLDRDYGWDDGLICGGQMTIGVAVLDPTADLAPYRDAVARAERREPAWFPVTVSHQGKPLTYRVHLEVPPTLVIAGAGHVGQALARLAVEVGFRVVVVDDRADIASRERFALPVELVVGDIAATLRQFPIDAATYVVIVTRGHRHDEQALEAVVRGPARYLGMIGSRRKAKTILTHLAEAGVPEELIGRVHCPIGLPIGSLTVTEIAVSIVAELIQQRRQDTPRLVCEPEPATQS